MEVTVIGFGGGCHWCTEAVFDHVLGVAKVEQGFMASVAPDDNLSEAVRVSFDADEISLSDLIRVHLATHASSSDHSMRGKYRSAVYVPESEDMAAVQALLDEHPDCVTRALPLVKFEESPPQFRDYYASDPERPFCQTYIDPKLAKLRREVAHLIKPAT